MLRDRSVKIVVLFLVPLLLYVVPLSWIPLMEPDEGRYSSISAAMNASGDYVTPRLKATVYFEKPPLSYWATSFFFRILGENEFSSRLFAAFCAWGCILLVYYMGFFFHDARTGLYAAAVLTTFLFHLAIGRINILDMPLAFMVCMAIWCGFRFYAGTPGKKVWLYLLYFFSGLAFLTKGLIGVAFPFGILLTWLLLSRRWRDLFTLFSPVGILIFCATAIPWLILIQREHPDFFRFFFLQEHLFRYVSRIHGHYQPVYYYLPILLIGTLPWCAFLPEVIARLGMRGKLFEDVEKKLLLAWFGLILVFFSVSSSKLVPYVTPLFPPIALAFGHLFRRYEEKGYADRSRESASRIGRLLEIVQPLLFTVILFAPVFLPTNRIPWSEWWPWIVIPALLQFMMIIIPRRIRNKAGKGWFAAVYLLFALYFISIIPPVAKYLSPYKSAYPLSQAVLEYVPADAILYQYGISLYGIDFYTGKRTPVVDDIGELRYGAEQLPAAERERYFLTSDSFFHVTRATGSVYCATRKGDRLAILKKEVPDLHLLWHNSRYALVLLNRSEEKGS